MLDAQFRGLAKQLVPVHRVAVVVSASTGIDRFTCADLFEDVRLRRHSRYSRAQYLTLRIGPLALCIVPEHQALRLFARQVGALETPGLRLTRWQEEHVAVAQQRFGT